VKEIVTKSKDVVDERAQRRMKYHCQSKEDDTTIWQLIQTAKESIASCNTKDQT
jgi:hypothetical protein